MPADHGQERVRGFDERRPRRGELVCTRCGRRFPEDLRRYRRWLRGPSSCWGRRRCCSPGTTPDSRFLLEACRRRQRRRFPTQRCNYGPAQSTRVTRQPSARLPASALRPHVTSSEELGSCTTMRRRDGDAAAKRRYGARQPTCRWKGARVGWLRCRSAHLPCGPVGIAANKLDGVLSSVEAGQHERRLTCHGTGSYLTASAGPAATPRMSPTPSATRSANVVAARAGPRSGQVITSRAGPPPPLCGALPASAQPRVHGSQRRASCSRAAGRVRRRGRPRPSTGGPPHP